MVHPDGILVSFRLNSLQVMSTFPLQLQYDIIKTSSSLWLALTAETILTLMLFFRGHVGFLKIAVDLEMTCYRLWRLTLMSCYIVGCEIVTLKIMFCIMEALHFTALSLSQTCGYHLHGSGRLFIMHLGKLKMNLCGMFVGSIVLFCTLMPVVF